MVDEVSLLFGTSCDSYIHSTTKVTFIVSRVRRTMVNMSSYVNFHNITSTDPTAMWLYCNCVHTVIWITEPLCNYHFAHRIYKTQKSEIRRLQNAFVVYSTWTTRLPIGQQIVYLRVVQQPIYYDLKYCFY